MKNPILSIIIPVYNVAPFLRQCLDSILAQTFTDFEVIATDDKSTDDSAKILKEYAAKDKRIKIILRKQNAGQSVARNDGLEIARGEYIGFVDPDDYIDKNFFENLIAAAKENRADIAIGGFRKIRTNGSVRYSKLFAAGVFENISDKIRHLENGSVCDKVFRRDLLEKNKMRFTPGRWLEDSLFALMSVCYANKIAVTPNALYNYRINENSTTVTRDSFISNKRRGDRTFILSEMWKFANAQNFDKSAKAEFKKLLLRSVVNEEAFIPENFNLMREIFGMKYYIYLFYFVYWRRGILSRFIKKIKIAK